LCEPHYREDRAGTLTEEVEPEEQNAYPNAVIGTTVTRPAAEAEIVEIEIKPRVTRKKVGRGKPMGSTSYPDEFILKVRAAWATGEYRSDGEIAKHFEIPVHQVGRWRSARKPDGMNWEIIKDRVRGKREPIRVELVPAATSDAVSLNRIAAGMGQRLMAIFMGLTGGGKFYTQPATQPEGRVEVNEIWNEDDLRIPLGCLMPTKYSEVVSAGETGVRILRDCLKVSAELEESQETVKREVTRHFVALAERLKLEPWQLEILREAEETGVVPPTEERLAALGESVVVEGEFEVEEPKTDDEEMRKDDE
jgi:hypothetical protein